MSHGWNQVGRLITDGIERGSHFDKRVKGGTAEMIRKKMLCYDVAVKSLS